MSGSKFKGKTDNELREMHADRQRSLNELNEELQEDTRKFTDDVSGAAGAQVQDDVGMEDVRETHMRAQANVIDSVRNEQKEIYDEIQRRKKDRKR